MSTLSSSLSSPTSAAERWPILLTVLLVILSLYRAAALHLAALDLYVDEAQYWAWAQKLEWGYYSKPPMIAAIIALTTAVCGNGELCVKSGSLLLYPAISLLIWAIARRLFGPRIAFWSALLFFTLPGVSFSAMIISTDVPLFLFWSLALYAYLRALDEDRWHWWLLAGLAGGLGLLTKYTMVIFALSVVLHLAVSKPHRRHLLNPRLYAGALLAALVFAPNLLWNADHGWPTLHHTTTISGLEHHRGLNWHEFWSFLGGQAAIVGPVFFLVWIVQLLRGAWLRDPRYVLLACFSLPFLAGISLQALLGRANANWAAMTYAAATIFFVARLIEHAQWRLLGFGFALNLLLMLAAYHYDPLAKLIGVPMNARTDVYKRVRGWSEMGRQAQVLSAQYPDALFLGDSRDVLAELEYYARPPCPSRWIPCPHAPETVLWNPEGRMDSHYALTTSMDNKTGYEFLYITRNDKLPPEMIHSFESLEALPPLHVTVHADYARNFRVWRLQNFLGYAPEPAPASEP